MTTPVERQPLARSLAIAAALHVAGLAALARWPAPATHGDIVAPAVPAPTCEVEVALEEKLAARPVGAEQAEVAQLAPRSASLGRVGSTSATHGETAGAAPLGPAPGDAEHAPPEPAPEGDEGPHLSLSELGVGDGRSYVRRAPESAEGRRGGAVGVQRSIAQALAEKDRKLGLGPAGPVLAALETAARSQAPNDSHALISVTFDAGGRVASVELVESNADHGAWTRVARRAATALARRRYRLPQGARGVRLEIAVDSRIQLPSGADPGLEVSVLDRPVKKGAGKRSAKLAILPLVPLTAPIEIPTMDGGSIKLPPLRVPLPLLGAAGDLSDLGARARAMVHAHVVDQQVL